MKSHKNSKTRSFAKKGFLKKRSGSSSSTHDPTKMDKNVTLVSGGPRQCDTDSTPSAEAPLCAEQSQPSSSEVELPLRRCPLAQDEIAICDAAESSANEVRTSKVIDVVEGRLEISGAAEPSQSVVCLQTAESVGETEPEVKDVQEVSNSEMAADVVEVDSFNFCGGPVTPPSESPQLPLPIAGSASDVVFQNSVSEPESSPNQGVHRCDSWPIRGASAPKCSPSTVIPRGRLSNPSVFEGASQSSSLDLKAALLSPTDLREQCRHSAIENKASSVQRRSDADGSVARNSGNLLPKKVTGGISQLVEETLKGLYEPFEHVKTELVRQARDILVCHYLGNLQEFHTQFLIPTANLLRNFKDKERICMWKYFHKKQTQNEITALNTTYVRNSCIKDHWPSAEPPCIHCAGWPLCLEDSQVAVRLGEIEPTLLKPDDYYLFVRPSRPGAELVLKYLRRTPQTPPCSESPAQPSTGRRRSVDVPREHVIGEAEFGKVFGMEGPHLGTEEVPAVSDEQVTVQLQHMLVSVENGIKRMRWELQHSSQQWAQTSPPMEQTVMPKALGSGGSSKAVATSVASSSDTLCSQTSSCCCCGLHSIDVKDSGVQTSPLEERKDGPSMATVTSVDGHRGEPETLDNNAKNALLRSLEAEEDLAPSAKAEGAALMSSSKEVVPTTSCRTAATATGAQDDPTDGSATREVKNCNDSSRLVDAEKKDSSGDSTRSNKDKQHWDAVSNGNEELDDGYHDNSITQPTCILETDERVVNSQVALIPGCRDRTGRVVVTVHCGAINNCTQVSAPRLAQLLMYFHALPRKELAARGLLILIDARNASGKSLEILDESFCLLEGNIPGAVNTVVFWTNSGSFSGTETSPRKISSPFPQSAVKFEIVNLLEEVKKVIKPDQLPTILGGEYVYDHQKWINFRKRLEPFIQSCRSVGKRMICVMQELKGSCLPSSAALTTQLIEQHKTFVGQVFDDPQLVLLQQTGPDVLRELEDIRRQAPNNHDFRDSIERCSTLYNELQRAIVKLVHLADKRLRKLEYCLQFRTLEEETTQVLSWLSKKGEETLNKHRVVANSLGGVKAQERDFEKFYFLAMRHIEKGNDLLEEAAMLGQKGNSDAFGMRDLAKSLKQHLSNFSTRLEDQREKLEDTSKCYQLLDKAYEWALEAMKFVSRLKMDQYTSPEQLSCLMKHLQCYLDSHPPLSDETFMEMIELATKLENERLLEQCKVAQVRCRETADLIHTRHQTLLKAKQQIEVESVCLRQHHQEHFLDQVSEAMVSHSPKLYQPTSPIWTPFSTSTPCYPYARRRSVAGLPYNLVSSPPSYSYFGASAMLSHKRRESLGANMLISEEQDESSDVMDNPLSRDIPNVDDDPSDGAHVECGKEDSSGASANTSSDGEVVPEKAESCERAGVVHSSSLSLTQAKKFMKRSQTWQFEDDVWDVLPPRPLCGLGQLSKNMPMRGSAESIPSITENDDSSLSHHSKMGSGYPPVPVNTHLHQRGSSLNLQFSATSMADLRQSDDQMKQRRTVLLIMREMIQTERDYVKSLEYIIENYIPELLRDDIPQALRGKRNVIFGNIEKIHEFHNRYFLHELEQCENAPSQVGQCFLRHESYFYLYALYNKNKPNSDSLMAEYGSSFFKSKQMELGDKMDLASYLLKPVQRMGKYALLLKQLLKEFSEKDPEYGNLTDAKEMVNFQLRHGNDLLAMDAIRECDVNLKEQGCLLRQDEFLVWQGKSRKCLRQVFLFEDLILFSKARRDPTKKGHDIYQYKHSIKMTDIGLTEQLGESNTKFEIWFRKRKISDTYTLHAPNPEVRIAWIQEVSKLLWKQALRNREVRLAEMSSMGIGNKPCLDIKPSEDQISDRSISISQLNKAPRFRNSIAITSSDYLRNNKRPHSIISVSSSSSGSSQSSGPYYGALNLGFDPSDSPKSRHRSVTQQSQCSSESGIIPDISMNYDSLTDCESHKKVERSNSSTSNDSVGICSLPMSPSSPASPEEDAGIVVEEGQ